MDQSEKMGANGRVTGDEFESFYSRRNLKEKPNEKDPFAKPELF